ncbi:hypothetical protein HDU97_007249 [Phlyctochytrium planicorne]|nr:hypothetical protein HDU97_007249 [Phlyctochytrium planicorne]
MGRAPSASGFVGGFRVAPSHLDRSIARQQQLLDHQTRLRTQLAQDGITDLAVIEAAIKDVAEKHGTSSSVYKAKGLPQGSDAHGNFALSSCPGKKVRLDTGPVNGRAMINRDLDLDFGRLNQLGVRLVVCCLNDAEMSYLGAPWPKYSSAAEKNGMAVLRRGYVVSAERAIQFIRVRRSPKAIETEVQEAFIEQYFNWVVQRRVGGEDVGPLM